MSQTRLRKSLYRTIFRFARNKNVKESILALDPTRFGALPDVLSLAGFQSGNIITSCNQITNLTRKVFRLPLPEEKSNEAVNSLLRELPRWFNERALLTQKIEIRQNNQNPDILLLRKFSLGDVVLHKDTQIRHIVIGWEIENGVQYIQTLSDHLDTQNSLERAASNSNSALHAGGRGEKSENFEIVTNYHLKRVLNESISDFFDGMDTLTGKYIPNKQLRFMYPADVSHDDLPAEEATLKASNAVITQETVSKNKARMKHERQMRYVASSVGGMLEHVNERVREILTRYDIDAAAVLGAPAGADPNLESSASIGLLTPELITKLVLDSAYKHIVSISKITTSLQKVVSSTDQSILEDRSVYEGISTLGALLIDVEKMLNLRWQCRGHFHFEEEMQHRLDWAQALSKNSSSSGQAQAPAFQPLEPPHEPPIYRLGEIVRTKKWGWKGTIISVHLRPDAPEASKWDGVMDTPSGAEQPFYRVLPDESDIAEGSNIMARLVAQENLELVNISEYAHNKRDVKGIQRLQQGGASAMDEKPAIHYVDATLNTWHVRNRLMTRYFVGFDSLQSRYIPKQKLLFVFPDNAASQAADSEEGAAATPSSNQAQQSTQPTAPMESNVKQILSTVNSTQVSRIRSERHARAQARHAALGAPPVHSMTSMQDSYNKGHAVAEAVLMEIYRVVKRVFSLCREQSTASFSASEKRGYLDADFIDPLQEFFSRNHSQNAVEEENQHVTADTLPTLHTRSADGVPLMHMSHLSFLIRHARRREDAMGMESIMWKVWMAHDNWRVSTEMLQGVQCIHQNKLTESLAFFQNAAAMDPQYSEPYNKMAAANLRLENYEACIENAQKSLSIYPLHYAALAGLGTALEKSGDLNNAVRCLERTLDSHPYAAHVPTFLQTVLHKQELERMNKVQSVLLATEAGRVTYATDDQSNLKDPAGNSADASSRTPTGRRMKKDEPRLLRRSSKEKAKGSGGKPQEEGSLPPTA